MNANNENLRPAFKIAEDLKNSGANFSDRQKCLLFLMNYKVSMFEFWATDLLPFVMYEFIKLSKDMRHEDKIKIMPFVNELKNNFFNYKLMNHERK